MEKTEILERLNGIFRDVFDDDGIIISENTISDDIEDWDSVTQVSLLVAIEKDFGIKFAMAEIAAFNRVANIVKALASSGKDMLY